MLTIEQQQLAEDNVKLAYFFASRWVKKLPKMEIDELNSLALMGLVEAAKYFKPEKGFAFSTLAERCVSNRIKKYLRDNKRHFVVDETKLYLDAPVTNQYDKDIKHYDLLVKDDDVFDLVLSNEIMKTLDELEPRKRLIFKKVVIEGLRQRELTGVLGVRQTQVSRLLIQTLNQIRLKFSEELV